MKIGIFGNTNNFPLMVAQAFHELGHEAFLAVNRMEQLHRPESRNPEFKRGYPAWILDVSKLSEWNFISLSPRLAPLLEEFSGCDALILNDLGPSLWPLLQTPAIALLTGSDLSHYANFATVDARTATWSPDYRASAEGQMYQKLLHQFIQRQREGIQKSFAIFHLPRGVVPESDVILDELGVSDSKRIFQYFAELDLIRPSPPPYNNPVRVFSATRLNWTLPVEAGRSSLDYKGSDIMIRGLALFNRQTGIHLDIRLIRKGLHVTETEQLIAEQGLTDQVNWLEEMPLTEVWSEFERSDIVFEQLANSAIGLAGMDALATGRPVIGNARPEIFQPYFAQPLPICQARTAEEVCAQVKRLVFEPDERQKIGELGRKFVEKHCSTKRFNQIVLERLEQALKSAERRTNPHRAGHKYYLQKIYEDRQTIQTLQQSLQNTLYDEKAELKTVQHTKVELQATESNSIRYEPGLLGKFVRKVAQLASMIKSCL